MKPVLAANEQTLESLPGSYRELFPVTSERAYLNHAALGTLSTRTVQALTTHIAGQSAHGSAAVPEWREMRQRTREKMAAFVGARPTEIAVTKNTPDSLSLLAIGLPWKPGDNVVICDLEFPANAHPWLNLAKRGVTVRMVHSQHGSISAESIIKAIDARTRLVALSWVQFSTGYRSDLRTIGAACRERGALLAVDAIQGLGALRFDVREMNVDFFGAASHKWLCGPTGVGWFYCRQELLEEIDLAIVGQGSYERGLEDSWLDYDRTFWPDARRFEPGLVNFLGLAGLEATLDLFFEVGMVRVEHQIKRLTDILVEGLRERDYRLAAPRTDENWSGIVSFASERHSATDILRRLEAAGVIVSLREGFIRVSPHFYNDVEDIERLLAALP